MEYCEWNRRWRWRDATPVPVTDPLYAWLASRDSLTSRLGAICEELRVVVHRSGFARVLPDELGLLSPTSQRSRTLVREVSLVCDNVPLVFGHSILLSAKHGALARSFGRRGNDPLGAILFANADIRRGAIYFRRIERRHPLYDKSRECLGDNPFFWARRSVFASSAERICVTEVFSPLLPTFS